MTVIVQKINTIVGEHNDDPSSHTDKQLKSNLVTSWSNNPSDVKYPSERLVKTVEQRVSNLEDEWGEFYEDMAG